MVETFVEYVPDTDSGLRSVVWWGFVCVASLIYHLWLWNRRKSPSQDLSSPQDFSSTSQDWSSTQVSLPSSQNSRSPQDSPTSSHDFSPPLSWFSPSQDFFTPQDSFPKSHDYFSLPLDSSSRPTLSNIPVEMIWQILEHVDMEDLQSFVLVCKKLHQCSTKRLREQMVMKHHFAVNLDMTDFEGCMSVIERLAPKRSRFAFYARKLFIRGESRDPREVSWENRMKISSLLLYQCSPKPKRNLWQLAVQFKSPQIMLFLALRLAPRITLVDLVDLSPDCDYFRGFNTVWTSISPSIQPRCNLTEIVIRDACLDGEFLSSLLRFTPPLKTFSWYHHEGCEPVWLPLKTYAGTSLKTLGCLNASDYDILFVEDFPSLRSIELCGRHLATSLARHLPVSIEEIIFKNALDSYPVYLRSFFAEFKLTAFPNLQGIWLEVDRQNLIRQSGDSEETCRQTSTFELARKPFKLMTKFLAKLNPEVAEAECQEFKPLVYGCHLKKDNLYSIVIAFVEKSVVFGT